MLLRPRTPASCFPLHRTDGRCSRCEALTQPATLPSGHNRLRSLNIVTLTACYTVQFGAFKWPALPPSLDDGNSLFKRISDPHKETDENQVYLGARA